MHKSRIVAFFLCCLICCWPGLPRAVEDEPQIQEDISLDDVQEGIPGKSLGLNLRYPHTGIAAADKILRTWCVEAARDFLQEFDEVFSDMDGETPQKGLTMTTPYSLDIIPYKTFAMPHALSVVLMASSYTGGAHGNHGLAAFRFRPDGSQLALKDVFGDVPQALRIFSEQSRLSLLRQEGLQNLQNDSALQEGTAPAEDNFTLWSITPAGIHVHFQYYQVGPYAIGVPEVDIPLAALAPAKPDMMFWSK